MTRRDWWMGITIIALVVVLHALLPRYDVQVHDGGFVRIDRWTGEVEAGVGRALPWVTLAKAP